MIPKFRIYDKRYKEMYYVDNLYWFAEQGISDPNDLESMGYDFMPYVCSIKPCESVHKYKNYKQIYIYKGDIIKYSFYWQENGQKYTRSVIFVVDYDEKHYAWIARMLDKPKKLMPVLNNSSLLYHYVYDNAPIEIIGNIYDPPALSPAPY